MGFFQRPSSRPDTTYQHGIFSTTLLPSRHHLPAQSSKINFSLSPSKSVGSHRQPNYQAHETWNKLPIRILGRHLRPPVAVSTGRTGVSSPADNVLIYGHSW